MYNNTMSTWISGKIKVKCSIEEMVSVVLAIRPSWKPDIKVDEDCLLRSYRYSGNADSDPCHILIPSHSNPFYSPALGMDRGDFALIKEDDGWTFKGDIDSLPEDLKDIEAKIIEKSAILVIKRNAENMRARLISEEETEGKTKLRFHVPVDKKYIFTD